MRLSSMRLSSMRLSSVRLSSMRLSSVRGSVALGIVVFFLGMFLGVASARADESVRGVKYVPVHADIVKFEGESEEHATRRIARIIGEANFQTLKIFEESNLSGNEVLIQLSLREVSFHETEDATNLSTILRDEVSRARDQHWFGSGHDRNVVVLFETRAFGGQEGLAMLGSGCSDYAAAVVASKGFSQGAIVDAGRTLAHEVMGHVWGALHDDFLVSDATTGAQMPTLMNAHAVGSFQMSQTSFNQIANYIAGIPAENFCLRDAPLAVAAGPQIALSAPVEMAEGEQRTLDIPMPSGATGVPTCAMEYDHGTLPFYTGQMDDAAQATVQLVAAKDAVAARGGIVSYEFHVRLHCGSFETDTLYQVQVRDLDLSPNLIAPQTVFPFRAGRSVNVVFWASNPAAVAGSPVVSCLGLPRGTKLVKRGTAYSFAVRASRNAAVSCTASNGQGTSSVGFQFVQQRAVNRR